VRHVECASLTGTDEVLDDVPDEVRAPLPGPREVNASLSNDSLAPFE
jgi:hypothetical protein